MGTEGIATGLPERVEKAPYKSPGKNLHTFKTQARRLFSLDRPVGRAEEPVPQAEDDAVVLSVWAVQHHIVVPHVEAGKR